VAALAFSGTAAPGGEVRDYPIRPVKASDVKLTDAFWAPRLAISRKVTVPAAFGKCEETGKLRNFDRAAGKLDSKYEGPYFSDSDLFKVVEGAAYHVGLARTGAVTTADDAKFEAYLDDVIRRIAAAQWADGYLYTRFSVPKRQPERRWHNIRSMHELYNAGHLIEAAVAHHEATGKRELLDVAIKLADKIDSVFGPEKDRHPPGHQEIELALAKLYRVTGEKRYLALAKSFLDLRGDKKREPLYGWYSQDHKPVVRQSEARGHAVRAMYMYAGMVDVAALTGDDAYRAAVGRLWDDVVSKKLYVTGGLGATHSWEGFREPYGLPNATAYAETCAAIANMLWSQRLFLLTGDGRYVDLVERCLYNAVLSGVSLEGDRFFYRNPLRAAGKRQRQEWFGCACCPTNIARTIPSVPTYAYAHNDDTAYVNLFITGSAELTLKGGKVRISQQTRHPWDGKVVMTVDPGRAGTFTLAVRIPGWARNRPVPSDLYRYLKPSAATPTITVNGRPAALTVTKGFVRLRRPWRKGDTVALNLPMPVRRVVAHEKVADDAGRVALQRGPIVYCIEEYDNKGRVLELLVPDEAALQAEPREGLLGGITVVTGMVLDLDRAADKVSIVRKPHKLVAVPYFAWANRDSSMMAVWVARDLSAVKLPPVPTIASTSRITTSFVGRGSRLSAICDQRTPFNSTQKDQGVLHWWPHAGQKDWVQYDFAKPATVSSATVYWFDETGYASVAVPESWRLLYKDGDAWKPVAATSPYPVKKDTFNTVTFKPVRTAALRLEVQAQRKDERGAKRCAGLLEWRVE